MLYNYDFGKLESDGQTLDYAPLNVQINGTWYCPASSTQLKDMGYKPIEDVPRPDDGNEYTSTWKELTKVIKRVWVKVRDTRTPLQKREDAYKTLLICEYGDGVYTVDHMNNLWYEYSAEGNIEKSTNIQEIISEAKNKIRKKYPDK